VSGTKYATQYLYQAGRAGRDEEVQRTPREFRARPAFAVMEISGAVRDPRNGPTTLRHPVGSSLADSARVNDSARTRIDDDSGIFAYTPSRALLREGGSGERSRNYDTPRGVRSGFRNADAAASPQLRLSLSIVHLPRPDGRSISDRSKERGLITAARHPAAGGSLLYKAQITSCSRGGKGTEGIGGRVP
jgi:hypothetical protein